MGTLARLERAGGRVDLEIDVPGEICDGVAVGDSVAVDGCCLTVTRVAAGQLAFQAVPETLRRTVLGTRAAGDPVNLERALRADARLDGHIVQGHVDGVGRVHALDPRGDDVILRVDCPPELAELLVPKGSVAIDGVSLTVVDADPDGFSVALIPHTLQVTTLGRRAPGDPVNLETDVIGKYVRRYLERLGPGAAGSH